MSESGASGGATVTLRVPADPAHVRTARLVAAAMARRSGVDEPVLDEIRLAVGEACARAVRLQERSGAREPVTVEFADGDEFRITVVTESGDAGAVHGASEQTEAPWYDPSGEALGLALLGAVVPVLDVTTGVNGSGSRVVMRWPIKR